MKRGNVRCVSTALAALLAISTGATAQQQAAPPPVSATPERTTPSFRDWTLRCERPDLPAGAPRICEIAQAITAQGQQAPDAQIAFGRIQKSDPLKATIVLPLNVTLSSLVMLATGEKDSKPLDANWQRCLSIRCLAELPLRDELLRRLRGISEPGAILFKDASGRDTHLPLSFCRPTQVLDALGKERGSCAAVQRRIGACGLLEPSRSPLLQARLIRPAPIAREASVRIATPYHVQVAFTAVRPETVVPPEKPAAGQSS